MQQCMTTINQQFIQTQRVFLLSQNIEDNMLNTCHKQLVLWTCSLLLDLSDNNSTSVTKR